MKTPETVRVGNLGYAKSPLRAESTEGGVVCSAERWFKSITADSCSPGLENKGRRRV